MRPSTKSLIVLALTFAAAVAPMAWLWGFTVDDALISGRVAHHLATGVGYRFNSRGPVVDAVTPLGFAYLLAPFASAGPGAAVVAARWLGATAWLGALLCLGRGVVGWSRRGIAVWLALLFSVTPLAAWVVAGMETGLVVALCTLGLLPGAASRVALGVAAALRPELVPWAMTLAAGRAFVGGGAPNERIRRVALALVPVLTPFILVAAIRTAVFGAAYPLAVLAKPPESRAGLRYALGALAFTGPAWTLIAGRGLLGLSPQNRVIPLAALVHVAALTLAGGDWMPVYRLFVPVLPSLLLASAELAEREPLWKTSARLFMALAACALIAQHLWSTHANAVSFQRQALIDGSRPWLRDATRVASLDIGWVGASTEAHVVDLAGVTDASVARLAGGHTTKRLPESFLESREIDALVLLVELGASESCDSAPDGYCGPTLEWVAAWPNLHFVRWVEHRIATLPGAERFRPVAVVPLLGTRQSYVIARKLQAD